MNKTNNLIKLWIPLRINKLSKILKVKMIKPN